MEKKNKNYWRPLWKGLVVDSEAKHIKRMGNSVWLFLYFILKANDRTGFLKKNYEAISREMGIKKRTVRCWLKNLRNKGYVLVQRKRDGFYICVRNWKTLRKSPNPVSAPKESDIILPLTSLESDKSLPFKGQNLATPGNQKAEKILYLREKMKEIGLGNRSIRYITNVSSYNRDEFNNLSLTKEGLLAKDLAEGLDDKANPGFYLSVARKYPEGLLRRILSEVRQIPNDKIKRSKGALFNYLLQNYDKKNS